MLQRLAPALVLARLHSPLSLPLIRTFKQHDTQSRGLLSSSPCSCLQHQHFPCNARARSRHTLALNSTSIRSFSSTPPPFNFNSLKIKVDHAPPNHRNLNLLNRNTTQQHQHLLIPSSQAIDVVIGSTLNFLVNRTFKWVRDMPKLKEKLSKLERFFPGFNHDDFLKGCGQAMEAVQVMSNEGDIVGARGCMTDGMFSMWQQAVELSQSEDYSLKISRCSVMNAVVIDVDIDEAKVHFPRHQL